MHGVCCLVCPLFVQKPYGQKTDCTLQCFCFFAVPDSIPVLSCCYMLVQTCMHLAVTCCAKLLFKSRVHTLPLCDQVLSLLFCTGTHCRYPSCQQWAFKRGRPHPAHPPPFPAAGPTQVTGLCAVLPSVLGAVCEACHQCQERQAGRGDAAVGSHPAGSAGPQGRTSLQLPGAGAVPPHFKVCCAVLCCVVLCCVVLCCAVLCCAVPFCAVPSCAELCHDCMLAASVNVTGSMLELAPAQPAGQLHC